MPRKGPKNQSSGKSGFDRSLEVEKIVGVATDADNKITFLIKWKNVNEAELVFAEIANQKIPQMVIAFYQNRLSWK